MICVIDNYDSFVYNLVQILGELKAETVVFRNDAATLRDIDGLNPDGIVLSPGPCTPDESGVCPDLVKQFAGKFPILGVCLGHQTIAQVFGGRVVRADRIVHGKVSQIHHDGKGIYHSVENPFTATRYHSLIVERGSLPSNLEISAWTDDGLIMGVRHRTHPVEGVQFHPESILTSVGKHLIRNFLKRVNRNVKTSRWDVSYSSST